MGESPFASITGTGDISAPFDDVDIYGGLLGGTSVLGLASTRIDAQLVVLADRDAPATKLIEVLALTRGGAVLAVEDKGRLAAFPLVFTSDGLGFAPPPNEDGRVVDLLVEVGAANVLVGNTVMMDMTDIKAGDVAALEAAISEQFKGPVFDERRDVRVSAREDAKIAHLMPALDAALSAGARAVRLESDAGGWGYGRSGLGPSGGTGWGTIGTGRYGPSTIGTGTGTSGPGGSARSAATVPQVSIGQPSANGDLDKNIIRRFIKRNLPKITYCYEKQLLVKPDLEGTVTTQFFISPNGSVASSNATGVDPEVASCVAAVIKDIEFPKPKGGGGVQVNYPFSFRSAK
jgi:hypothetical protein